MKQVLPFNSGIGVVQLNMETNKEETFMFAMQCEGPVKDEEGNVGPKKACKQCIGFAIPF
jgi:hypothetical protein